MMRGQSGKAVSNKPLIAGLLLGMFLSVLAMAQFQALHHALHPEAGQPNHECAVTLLTSGQIETATVGVSVSLAPSFVITFQLPETPVFTVADYSLLPGRAPPASLT
jgi:hypothetical protein